MVNYDERNKTRTSKVGAISKAQKAQKFFRKKLEIFQFLVITLVLSELLHALSIGESLDGERTVLWMHEQQSLVSQNAADLYSSYFLLIQVNSASYI